MLVFAVSFSALILAQGPSPARQPTDSVRAAKVIERAREEELKLLADWRIAWLALRDLNSSGSRFWSLHCHFDEIGGDDGPPPLHSPPNRESLWPGWFPGGRARADQSARVDKTL